MQLDHQLLADVVLVVHVLFVVFVIFGLLLTVLGGLLGWTWIRNAWFRITHLVGIGVVVVQAWAGVICPLTTFEMWLRRQSGEAHYVSSFIEYWLKQLLYYDAPMWVFGAAYTLFGLLVAVTWARFPPSFMSRSAKLIRGDVLGDRER